MIKTKSSEIAHDVAITNVLIPSDCNQGDTIPVIVRVANQGTRRESITVGLVDQTSGKEIASQEVTLAKGWKDGSEDVADLIFDTEEAGVNYFANQVWM